MARGKHKKRKPHELKTLDKTPIPTSDHPFEQGPPTLASVSPRVNEPRASLGLRKVAGNYAGFVTLILTLILAWIYWNQLQVMRGQLREMSLENRPWVGPEKVVDPHLVANSVPTYGVVLTNTGKTPAFNFRTGMRAVPVKRGEAFKPSFPDWSYACRPTHTSRRSPQVPADNHSRSLSVLFPGMHSTPYELAVGPLSQSNIEELENGALAIYLYGWASYEDTEHNFHCTNFCSFFSTDLVNSYNCTEYNDAD